MILTGIDIVEDGRPTVAIIDDLAARSGVTHVASGRIERRPYDPSFDVLEINFYFDSSAWTGRR